MINHKIFFTMVLAACFCLITSQTIAKERDTQISMTIPDEIMRGGVIDRIDVENGQLVIGDMIFSFLPGQLAVYRAGLVSSVSALQPGQQVRYNNSVPGGSSGNRASSVISKIWIEK